MEEVLMEFDENDNPVITVKGAKGSDCYDLTSDLEKKLGKVVKDEKTREFREEAETGARRGSSRR